MGEAPTRRDKAANRGLDGKGRAGPTSAALPRMRVMRPAAGSDTMLAWERFLTGDPQGISPIRNFVVASWQRSLQLGVNPAGRAAPMAVEGPAAIEALRRRHRELLTAASGIFSDAKDLFVGSNAIMLLTDPDGVVLDVVGDASTMQAGREINLTQGGDWREVVVGTNGIGTALATGRPAQVHAAEHFCEGIKQWTCAAAPVYEPGTGAIMGVVDISGPPSSYQRNNLTLAVATARQIEAVLAERAAAERTFLLETCLDRLSAADAAGVILLDRTGRLVHAHSRVPTPVAVGERLPGLDAATPIDHWPELLPANWRAEWFNPVKLNGRAIGAMLVVPDKPRALAGRRQEGSEFDPAQHGFDSIVGRSEAMQRMIAQARLLARRRVPVLIEGETGTGKELLARAIHSESDADRPFIVFNCGMASRELFAGELFGHVRGAFTGASAEGRAGRFELAHHGTLCLDEIGEMPLDVQPMLLRALDEGVIYRLGDSQPRRVDVRLIAMTNRNLREEAAAGRFRRDLFYRIGATAITIPPLRTRDGDVERLVAHFNASLARRHDLPPRRFTPELLEILRGHSWDGNVRELRNVVQALLLADTDAPVLPAELPAFLRTDRPGSVPEALQPRLADAEREAIRRALSAADGNHTHAAQTLGISRSTLYRKLKQFGL